MMFCPACAPSIAMLAGGAVSAAGMATLAFPLWRRALGKPEGAGITHSTESEMEQVMDRPVVATREEWLEARRALLEREKDATRERDALAAARRALPMVKVEKPYTFEGPAGRVDLRELFGDKTQLVVYHFMFAPNAQQGCAHCSYVMDNVAGGLPHLAAADTAFAAISRAPLAKIDAFKQRLGWTFPWYSAGESDFNYDFHVTIDESRGSVEYNYEDADELRRRGKLPPTDGDFPGFSVFTREGDTIFHTYSTYTRGVDIFLNTYNLLDMTPLGRNEDGPMEWVRHRDRY